VTRVSAREWKHTLADADEGHFAKLPIFV